MTTVAENIDLPGGTAPSGYKVEIELCQPNGTPTSGYHSSSSTTIMGPLPITLDGNGAFTAIDLKPNADITPTGTIYRRLVDGLGVRNAWYFQVPTSGTNVNIQTIGYNPISAYAAITTNFSSITVGGVTLTGEVHSGIKHLLADGIYHDFHPVVFRSPVGASEHNGTVSGTAASGNAGVPRITLAKGQRIKWVEGVPAGWDNAGINMLWCKEATGSGNVHWRISYQVLPFLGATDLDDGALTQAYDANVAVPSTVGAGTYTITGGTFATAPQLFGIPPVLHASLERINDGTDTYSGSASVAFTSLSFVAV